MDSVAYPVDAEFVPGQRGTRVLLGPLRNRMSKKRVDGKMAIYECGKKRLLSCPVTVTLDTETNKIVSGRGEHNHDSDLLKSWVKNEVNHVVDSVYANPVVAPRAILQVLEDRVLEQPSTSAGLELLPKAKTLARKVQRKRRAEWGTEANLPTCWEEMAIPQQYLTTSTGEPFVILDHTMEAPQTGKVWMFASDFTLHILKSSDEWYLDGTFQIVKETLFSQLYVVVCKAPRSSLRIPCVFALLPDKTKATYSIIFNKLKELGVAGPKVAHLDYEMAVYSTIKKVFPATDLVGCDVHWKRNLRDNLREVGLLKHSNTEQDVQTWTRMLWCLSYVPVNDVVEVFDYIVTKTPVISKEHLDDSDAEEEADVLTAAINAHLEYFVNAYVGKVHPVTNVRGNPRIPHQLWSNYKAVLDGANDVTNNSSENWNSVSKITLPMKPSIWAVLMALKCEEQHAKTCWHASLGDDQDEDTDNTRRVKDRIQRYKKLRMVLQTYREVPLEDYINALMALFND